MINLSSIDIKNKNLVIRVDMNVPLKNGNVLDATRIEACLPTIDYALKNNAKILLISHLGRPTEGNFEEKFSLMPVAKHLSKIINQPCELIDTPNSDAIFNNSCEVQLLENIRFFQGEKTNSDELGYKLANLGDVYVFDAFGTSHRAHASTYGAIKASEVSCAGLLLENETNALQQAISSKISPMLSIVGGSKVSSKLEVIKNLSKISDDVMTGGGITNTILKAQGHNIGLSLYEESMLNEAKELLESGKILLPDEVIVSKDIESNITRIAKVNSVQHDEMILDQILSSRVLEKITQAKKIIWNGPIGVFERQAFSLGTKDLAEAIASSNAFSLAGGGETLLAIKMFIEKNNISYCSTGGGAFLEFMEGKELPSLSALGFKF